MAFTRAQYRTRVQRRMDASSSTRWDTTAGSTGEIDQVLGFVFDREWRRILNANPYYRTELVQPTADSSGRFLISDLSTGSGNTAKRFYRVISVIVDNQVYEEVDFKDWTLAAPNNLGSAIWYRNGDYIFVVPVQAGNVLSGNEGIWVSNIPCRIDNLSADGDSVTFPDGYEEIICLEAAAHLLAKGGAETETTAAFKALAESMRQDLLADVARFSINPKRMRYADYSHDWGG